jgi:hypothetical protein
VLSQLDAGFSNTTSSITAMSAAIHSHWSSSRPSPDLSAAQRSVARSLNRSINAAATTDAASDAATSDGGVGRLVYRRFFNGPANAAAQSALDFADFVIDDAVDGAEGSLGIVSTEEAEELTEWSAGGSGEQAKVFA